MSTTETKKDAIRVAAETVRPLFLLNEWTWRNEGVPSLLDIEATFSRLAWTLRDEHGWNGDGERHYAATGRLLVVQHPNGDLEYGLHVGREYAR